jgi:urea carboxylase system permease
MSDAKATSAAPIVDEQQRSDSERLQQLGYRQELRRSMSGFSNFAVAFSYISVTTGIFALFAFGLGTGGPAFIWSWPIVFAGQLLVGLVFAELASHYPVAGSVFQWTKQVAGRDVAWMDGWIYLVAQVATIASVEFVVPPVIATIFGWDVSNTRLLIVIALILLAVTTTINILGVRLLAIINNVGVLAELVGMVVLGTLLLLHAHHPVSFLSDTGGTQGSGSYIGVFFAAMLMSLFVVYGFDTAGTMAEETRSPSKSVPRALLIALLGSFVIGGLFLLGAVLAVPSGTGDLAKFMGSSTSLEDIISAALPQVSNYFFGIVSIAIAVCGLSVQANAARLLFSMARDRQVPGNRFFGYVSPSLHTPIYAVLATGVLAAVLIFLTQVEAVLVAVTVVLIYLAYAICTASTLWARLRRGWPATQAPFSLGRYGLAINALAVLWGVAMIINLSWYRPVASQPGYLNLAILFVPLIVLLGAAYYFGWQRRQNRTDTSPTG